MALHHRLARLERQAQARREAEEEARSRTERLLDRLLLVLSPEADADPNLLATRERFFAALDQERERLGAFEQRESA